MGFGNEINIEDFGTNATVLNNYPAEQVQPFIVQITNRLVEVKRFKIKKVSQEKNTMIVEITIIEGRNHIIKKLFKELNIDVMKLSRIGYGFLDIKDLKSGEYRNLSIKEIKKLYSIAKK